MVLSIEAIGALACFGMIVVLGVSGGLQIRSYLARTPVLATEEDLTGFKRVIAQNMVIALLAIGLALAGALFLGAGYVRESLTFVSGVLVFGLCGLLLLVSLWTKSEEARLKKIPTANPTLAKERDRLVEIWVSRALPRF